jgi:hypothetical protein
VYADIRKLVTIDLDTTSEMDLRVLSARILTAANANSLTTLSSAIQRQLAGTPDDLRTFLRTQLQTAWSVDLRIAVYRTLTNAGSHVQTAAQQTLTTGTIDAYLAYLDHGLVQSTLGSGIWRRTDFGVLSAFSEGLVSPSAGTLNRRREGEGAACSTRRTIRAAPAA